MSAARNCCRLLLLLTASVGYSLAHGDDPVTNAADEAKPSRLKLKDEVREALLPLFSSIAKADVSRVTVELTAESVIGGAVVDSQKSTYQIASNRPDKFTIYLKEPQQRTRVYCNGTSMIVALAADAYLRLPDALDTQNAVVSMPVPLGPYPEPILALSLAGVDPAISLLGGMKSVELVDRNKLRGEIPAIHLRGVQDDLVSWEFWITEGDQPRPLRLLIDLTAMLKATEQVQVPEDFCYQLRIDFLSWRISGEVDAQLFEYVPPEDAVEYKSLEDYFQTIAGVVAEHPLLGKPAPNFVAKTIDGKEFHWKDMADKVVVLDFWATWCDPCVAAIPVLKQVADDFADQGVVFYAVNAGEATPVIKEFVDQQKWDVNVLIDPEGKITDAFKADAIPQTVIVGKNGIIESVHIGFTGPEGLTQRLTDELKVLSIGGQIASAENKLPSDKLPSDKLPSDKLPSDKLPSETDPVGR